MKISTFISKEESIAFLRYYFFKRNISKKTALIFFPSLLVSYNLIHDSPFDPIIFTLILCSLLSALVILFLVIPYMVCLFKMNRNYASSQIFSIEADGIETNDILYKWNNFKVAGITPQLIFVKLYGSKFLLFPIKDFLSQKHISGFYTLLKEEIQQNRLVTGRHLYNWGWLGLIPNFGLITGVIFVHKGLFKYGDKKLVVIGIADILFTIIFWAIFLLYINPHFVPSGSP